MFDFLRKQNGLSLRVGVISYGRSRKDGGHDHRTNRGDDRTAAQRQGDAKRSRKDSRK